jgi:hypothetical protein
MTLRATFTATTLPNSPYAGAAANGRRVTPAAFRLPILFGKPQPAIPLKITTQTTEPFTPDALNLYLHPKLDPLPAGARTEIKNKSKIKIKNFALVALCAWLGTFNLRAATYTWSGAGFFGQDYLWSNDFNWAGGVAPSAGEAIVTIIFPNNASPKVTTNDIVGLSVASIQFQGANYVVHGKPAGNTLGFSSGGVAFQITYHGGDGNDIAFTQLTLVVGPQITGIQKLGNGSVQLAATGIPNAQYVVEATPSLTPPVSWTVIGTAIADANGHITFTDADAPNFASRFYRFKLQ